MVDTYTLTFYWGKTFLDPKAKVPLNATIATEGHVYTVYAGQELLALFNDKGVHFTFKKVIPAHKFHTFMIE